MTNRWQRSLDEFTKRHSSDASENVECHDLLFVVSPASGGGNAMRLYPTCFEELKATGRAVEVYVNKSSEDVIHLSKTKDLSPYKTIVFLSGDSTLYEFLQAPLQENNGKWPYQSALLLLPGGSSNVIALEDFGPKACVKQIIRQTLSLWNDSEASIQQAPVIKVSSETTQTTLYSLHVCMTGFVANLIDIGERRRQDVYPWLGKAGWTLSILASIPFMDNEQDDPTLLNVFNSDTEPNADFGFENSRFDNNLTIIYIPKSKNPGKKELATNMVKKLMSGDLAKEWKEGTLPDYITVVKSPKWVYRAPSESKSPLKFYSDGTSQLPFECQDDTICFESVPGAVPFWTVPNRKELEPSPNHHWDIETVSVLSNTRSVRDAYRKLASPGRRNADNQAPLLQEGDSYQDVDSGSQITVLESRIGEKEEEECTFRFSSSSSYFGLPLERETKISVAKQKDGLILAKVQEKRTGLGFGSSGSDTDTRLAHRNLLANLDAAIIPAGQ